MPFITINVKEPVPALNLKQMVQEMSTETGLAPERLNLVVNTYSDDRYYRGSGSTAPVVHIAVRAHNGVNLIQSLMKSAAKAISAQSGVDADKVVVYVHPIEDGFFLSGGSIQ